MTGNNESASRMYLRFQGQMPNPGTANKLGIFQLAIQLRDWPELPSHAYNELRENLDWFNRNLKSPDVLDDEKEYRAIAWFKPAANDALQRIWAIKAILEEYGYRIDLVKSRDPGNIVYEDRLQVIARPRRKKSKG